MKKIFFILFFFSFGLTFSQKTTRILFILDASNSMNLNWDKQTRMDAAKEILIQSVEKLRGIPNLEIALRVYGHQSEVTNTYQDCADTKLEVPFAANTVDAIQAKVRAIRAKGATPIARSLEAAAGDFPDTLARNFIILITLCNAPSLHFMLIKKIFLFFSEFFKKFLTKTRVLPRLIQNKNG